MVSVWDWVNAYHRKYAKRAPKRQGMLMPLWDAGSANLDQNPDVALEKFREGRTLAQELDEKWWGALFEMWIAHTVLIYKHDYATALELSIKTSMKVRKPEYSGLPQRICIHEDLILAYIETDPHGYAQMVESAMSYMQAEITEDIDCRYCFLNLRVKLALLLEQAEQVERASSEFLAAADSSKRLHYQAQSRIRACEVAFRRNAWSEMLTFAQEGVLRAEKIRPEHNWIPHLMIWQAVALAHLDRTEEAQKAHQNAIHRLNRSQQLRSAPLYDALCAYLEAGGDFAGALAERDDQLRQAQSGGSPYHVTLAHIKRCEVLSHMQQLTESDLQGIRDAATKLKDSAWALAKLAQLTDSQATDSARG
jgi:hypothetical protein